MIPKAKPVQYGHSYNGGEYWQELDGTFASKRDAAIAYLAEEDEDEHVYICVRGPLTSDEAARYAGQYGAEALIEVMQDWAWDQVGDVAEDWLYPDREEEQDLERNLARAVMAWFAKHDRHRPRLWAALDQEVFLREDLATEIAEAQVRHMRSDDGWAIGVLPAWIRRPFGRTA